jgi:hypothetical protein
VRVLVIGVLTGSVGAKAVTAETSAYTCRITESVPAITGTMFIFTPTGLNSISVATSVPNWMIFAFGNGNCVSVEIAAMPPLRTTSLGVLVMSARLLASSASSTMLSSHASWMPPSVKRPTSATGELPTIGWRSGNADE